MSKNISKLMTVNLVGGLGVVDFQPSPTIAVIFLAEGDIICGTGSLVVKLQKLAKLKSQNPKMVTACIFLRTELSVQYFESFQKKIVLEFSSVILPITNQDQVPQLLQQLFLAESHKNPFQVQPLTHQPSSRQHKDLLLAVCKIPGLGEKKSRNLLQKMDSIRKIARARNPELCSILGPNLARGVEDFFRKRNTI